MDENRDGLCVLVEVSGGVASVSADSGVDVLIVDYDDTPDAQVPAAFMGLGFVGSHTCRDKV